jgi:predicted dehydrogenase
LEAFARIVRGEEEHEIGRAADAVAVMAVIEAAREASAHETEVMLPAAQSI